MDKLILVGGATRMPVVRALLRVTFGIEPQRTVDPDEAVALGAAIHAGMMDGDGSRWMGRGWGWIYGCTSNIHSLVILFSFWW